MGIFSSTLRLSKVIVLHTYTTQETDVQCDRCHRNYHAHLRPV